MKRIYTLADPRDNVIRYIGITKTSLNRRLAGHIHDCKSKKPTHKINWIKSLLLEDLKPIIQLIDEVDDTFAYDEEIYWISQFKTWGFNLVNSTNGGEVPTTKPGKDNPNYGNKYNQNNKTTRGPVIQLDFKGNIINSYTCAQQAELNGFSPGVVNLCIHHKRTQHKGFQFIYKNEYDKNKDYKFTPKNTQAKKVEQIDKITNKVINKFNSTNEAAIYISGKSHDNVARVCRGERKTYRGFIWRFKNE